jgi:TPR repeat protein
MLMEDVMTLIARRSLLPVILAASAAGPPSASADAPPAQPRLYKRVVALCIGIDKYRSAGIPALSFAESDAKALAEKLRHLYGYQPVLLLGREATKRTVDAKVAELSESLGDHDALVVFFAGHGQIVELPSYGRAGYLVPYDADLDLGDRADPARWASEALDMRGLVDRIERAKAQHVLVVADACCSGFMTKRGGLEDRADLLALLRHRSRGVLAAATERQPAREDPDRRRGYFTGALLDQLGEYAERRDAASVTDLFVEVRRRVSRESNKLMLPQLARVGDGDGEFVFIPQSIPREDVEAAFDADRRDDGRPHALRGVLEAARKRAGRRTTLADVVEAHDAGDYRFAVARIEKERVWRQKFDRFHEAAALADPLAMAGLHYCYAKGLGVEPRPAEAYRWAQRAYDSGQPAGRHVLGRCLLEGVGVVKNERAADALIREASAKGFPISHVHVGLERLQSGDIAGGMDRLNRAAADGVQSARIQLARLHSGAFPGVKVDLPAALEALRPAAERGHPAAQFGMAEALSKLPSKDLAEVAHWLERSAEGGFALAQYHMASVHYRKFSHPHVFERRQDFARARQWAELGAAQDEPFSCMLLCDLYEHGDGGPKDFDKARECCERAARMNHAPAIARQGEWHALGTVLRQDDAKAMTCFRRAAEMNDASGCSWMGYMYENARGVRLDGHSRRDMEVHYRPEAMHWYMKAMKAGGTPQADKRLKDFFRDCVRMGTINEDGSPPERPLGGYGDTLMHWRRRFPDTAEEFVRRYARRQGK